MKFHISYFWNPISKNVRVFWINIKTNYLIIFENLLFYFGDLNVFWRGSFGGLIFHVQKSKIVLFHFSIQEI